MNRVFSLWHFVCWGGGWLGSTGRYSHSHDWVVSSSMAHTGGGGATESPLPHHHFLVLSHPGLDLTHGDVVDWGLLPPGALGDHHLQQTQQWYVMSDVVTRSDQSVTTLSSLFSTVWLLALWWIFLRAKFLTHRDSLEIICFMRKDETTPRLYNC